MTPSEFRSWFDGFTEAMDGPPSQKQWERIQARVKEITGTPTTYPVFVERYWPAIHPVLKYPAVPYWQTQGISTCSRADGVGAISLNAGPCDGKVGSVAFSTTTPVRRGDGGTVLANFDSHAAMNALGKADAQALAA